ncbi:unnamed protein product [Caretta caretta]
MTHDSRGISKHHRGIPVNAPTGFLILSLEPHSTFQPASCFSMALPPRRAPCRRSQALPASSPCRDTAVARRHDSSKQHRRAGLEHASQHAPDYPPPSCHPQDYTSQHAPDYPPPSCHPQDYTSQHAPDYPPPSCHPQDYTSQHAPDYPPPSCHPQDYTSQHAPDYPPPSCHPQDYTSQHAPDYPPPSCHPQDYTSQHAPDYPPPSCHPQDYTSQHAPDYPPPSCHPQDYTSQHAPDYPPPSCHPQDYTSQHAPDYPPPSCHPQDYTSQHAPDYPPPSCHPQDYTSQHAPDYPPPSCHPQDYTSQHAPDYPPPSCHPQDYTSQHAPLPRAPEATLEAVVHGGDSPWEFAGVVYTTVRGRSKIYNFSYMCSVADIDVLGSTYRGVFTAAVNKIAEEHEIWKQKKESLQQELEKLRLQNEGMKKDLQTALMQNVTNVQQMAALTQTCQESECDMDTQMQEKQKYKLEAKLYKGAVSVLTEQATKPPGKENHKKYIEVINNLESALVMRKTICSMAFDHNPWNDEEWENVVKEWQREKA